jgi:nucleotide-binding universal stress UspA family protein
LKSIGRTQPPSWGAQATLRLIFHAMPGVQVIRIPFALSQMTNGRSKTERQSGRFLSRRRGSSSCYPQQPFHPEGNRWIMLWGPPSPFPRGGNQGATSVVAVQTRAGAGSATVERVGEGTSSEVHRFRIGLWAGVASIVMGVGGRSGAARISLLGGGRRRIRQKQLARHGE